MADNTASNVGIGTAGKVYIAPAGTAAPADAVATLASAYENFGYISTDGVTLSENTSSNNLDSWGGQTVRVLKTSYSETFTFTPIEINEVVLKAMYGDNQVTTTVDSQTGVTKIVALHKNVNLPEVVIVIDTVESDTVKRRYVMSNAQLTERGDATHDGTGASGREMTYTANPNSSGVTCTELVAIYED